MSQVRLLRRCLVLGGSGAVGELFARALEDSGAEVVVADPATGGGDATAPDAGLIAELTTADLVLLTMPERTALAALPVLAPRLRPGTLVADTLSVKGSIVTALAGLTMVQSVSLNPMFAPSLGFSGKPVAAVTIHSGDRVDELLALLGSWGARPVPCGPAEHDRLAAATQVLTHATVLGFGLALTDLCGDLPALAAIAPPPHRTLLALLARITAGTPEVYWDVQAANSDAPAARAALAGGLRRIADLVDRGDEAGFSEALAGLRAFFGADLSRHADLCAELFDGLPPSEET